MSESKDTKRFKEVLSKTLSVSREEMQRRIEQNRGEKEHKHKRFSYIPSKVSPSR